MRPGTIRSLFVGVLFEPFPVFFHRVEPNRIDICLFIQKPKHLIVCQVGDLVPRPMVFVGECPIDIRYRVRFRRFFFFRLSEPRFGFGIFR